MNFRYRVRAADGTIYEGDMQAESQELALQQVRQWGEVLSSP